MQVVILGQGKMGKLLKHSLKPSMHLLASLSRSTELKQLKTIPDLIFDFSHADNLQELLEYALKHHVRLVIGTTNMSVKQEFSIHAAANQIAILHDANFSFGVAMLKKIVREITPILETNFDMEVIEKHHAQKNDAPSGTAKELVKAMDSRHVYSLLYGRRGETGGRGHEIGIHAIRGGTLAGEHTVCYFGEDESLELTHQATSRQVFVNGALLGASFLMKHDHGYYTMEDVLSIGGGNDGNTSIDRHDSRGKKTNTGNRTDKK